MARVWKYQCGKCSKVYESPVALTHCTHRCSLKSTKSELMELITETEGEEV